MNQTSDPLLKKIIIAVIIILTSIAIVVLIYLFFYSPVAVPVATPSPSNIISDQAVIDKTAALIKANDLAGCDSVNKIVDGADYRNVCRDNILNNLAKKNLDFNSCSSLSKPSSSEYCNWDVLELLIEKEKNIAVCDKAPEALKANCPDVFWRVMAKAETNPELCAKIVSPVGASNCQETVFTYMLQQGRAIDCKAFTDQEIKTVCALPDQQRKEYLNYHY